MAQGDQGQIAGASGLSEVDSKPAQPGRIPLQTYWDHGLRFVSDNDKFNLHIGGTGQIDSVYFFGPSDLFNSPSGGVSGIGNAQASFLRRAVLLADGRIYDHFEFRIQYDFANASNENSGEQPDSFSNLTTSPAPLNVWLQINDIPVLDHLRMGIQSKTIGMESNTSGANLSFMERSDNMDAFYGPFDNGHSLGITAFSWDSSERMTWKYGIYQPQINVFGVALNRYALGTRLTGLLYDQESDEQLMHLGLGYWVSELVQGQSRSRVRPLLRNGPGFAVPILADTGEIPGSRMHIFAPELAMAFGPFTLQAEYAIKLLTEAIDQNGQEQGTLFFHGGYIEALWFLTGEHQNYDRHAGTFGRVIPKHNYLGDDDGCGGGKGAWQLGIRFSFVDLNDKTIQGGQLYSWTFGVNWFLNPNMKIQLNYLLENRDTAGVPPGWIQGLGLRASFDF